jgi:hypothetical protein
MPTMTFSRLFLPATTFVAAHVIVLALVLFSWSVGSP